MPELTLARIATVQAHVTEALTRTSDGSTVPRAEQVRLLAQACVESCDLLSLWLEDSWWNEARPDADRPIKEFVPSQKEFTAFVGPTLTGFLERMRQNGMSVPSDLVEQAYTQLRATARRSRMNRRALLSTARSRITSLQGQVCQIASQAAQAAKSDDAAESTDEVKHDSLWRRARKTLLKVSGVLLPIAVALITSTTPHIAAHDVMVWGHEVVHVIDVMTVHHLASQAEPGVRVAPPSAGPRVS